MLRESFANLEQRVEGVPPSCPRCGYGKGPIRVLRVDDDDPTTGLGELRLARRRGSPLLVFRDEPKVGLPGGPAIECRASFCR